MADAVCIGGGSQDAWINLTPEQILEGFGYSYNAADPLASTYQQIARQYNPYASGSKFYNGFNAFAEACMRARAVLFCNSSAGDCGGGQSGIGIGGNAPLAGEALGFAETGAGIGEALAGASSALGPLTLGVGDIVGAVIGIFQQHAKAVAAQANALCTLCPSVSQAIAQLDNYVSIGSANATQAANGILTMSQQFANSVASLTKNCNAFCMYTALIKCVAYSTPAYYATFGTLTPAPPQISPVISSYAPNGGVATTPVPVPVIAPVAPTSNFSGETWLLVAAALVILVLLLSHGS